MTHVHIVDAFASGLVDETAQLMFEYIAMTQVEAGRPRPDTVDDLPPVLRVDCQQARSAFAEPGSVLLACKGNKAIGCVGIRIRQEPGRAEIGRLFVRPAHQRHGVATRLMLAAHAHARAIGITDLVLAVMPTRVHVIGFYRRLGYVETEPYEEWSIPMVHLRLTLADWLS